MLQTSAFVTQTFHDDLCYCLRARFKKTYIPKVGHLSKIEAPKSKLAIQTPRHLSLSTEGTCTLSSLLVQNTHLEFCCCTSSVIQILPSSSPNVTQKSGEQGPILL